MPFCQSWEASISSSREGLNPGLGKSRLFIEFECRHLHASGALVLHGRCLPYGEALSYWALIAALKEACGITHDTQTEIARVKLEELIHELFPHAPRTVTSAN